jgi:hypothetical protein
VELKQRIGKWEQRNGNRDGKRKGRGLVVVVSIDWGAAGKVMKCDEDEEGDNVQNTLSIKSAIFFPIHFPGPIPHLRRP